MKLLLGIVLTIACLARPGRTAPALANGIAVIVNDSIVTLQQVYQLAEPDLVTLERVYWNKPEILPQKREAVLRDAVELLTDRQLILEDFKTSGLNLPESYIDEEVRDQIRKRYGDRVQLTKTLRAQGGRFETFRQRAREEIILMAMEQKNIRSAILISPKKIETYYVTNLVKFKLEDRVKLRLISLGNPNKDAAEEVRRRAQEILLKVNQGASFAEMAAVYSENSQARAGGLLWDWVERARLNKGLSEIAFSLPLDTPSRVIGMAKESDDAYWIYQYDPAGRMVSARKYSGKESFLEARTALDQPGTTNGLPPPIELYVMMVEDKQLAHVRPLEEVREEIERELILQERATLRKKWIDRLKTKSFVRTPA